MSNEAFGRMLDEYVREMQAIIVAHGGYIEDVSGDGILGYAGNFDSGGKRQDAIAVVALCIEMRRRLAALVPEFRQRYGLKSDLNVRIGISSGEATVGRTAGARAIYTANGDIVNLGAKLEKKVGEICATGGILVSQATADLIGDAYDLEPHRIEVEGAPLAVYRVMSVADKAV
jgi:class 3 adenylate cyclase